MKYFVQNTQLYALLLETPDIQKICICFMCQHVTSLKMNAVLRNMCHSIDFFPGVWSLRLDLASLSVFESILDDQCTEFKNIHLITCNITSKL